MTLIDKCWLVGRRNDIKFAHPFRLTTHLKVLIFIADCRIWRPSINWCVIGIFHKDKPFCLHKLCFFLRLSALLIINSLLRTLLLITPKERLQVALIKLTITHFAV